MRFNRTYVAFVVALLAAVIPALAADPAPAAAPEVAPEAAPAQPAEFPWLTPEPIQNAGQIFGNCTVSIPCRYGPSVGCSGQYRCQWQFDSTLFRGYVECDSARTWCALATEQ